MRTPPPWTEVFQQGRRHKLFPGAGFLCDTGAGDCGTISDTSLKRALGRSSVTDTNTHTHVCNSHPSWQEGMSHVL